MSERVRRLRATGRVAWKAIQAAGLGRNYRPRRQAFAKIIKVRSRLPSTAISQGTLARMPSTPERYLSSASSERDARYRSLIFTAVASAYGGSGLLAGSLSVSTVSHSSAAGLTRSGKFLNKVRKLTTEPSKAIRPSFSETREDHQSIRTPHSRNHTPGIWEVSAYLCGKRMSSAEAPRVQPLPLLVPALRRGPGP